MKQFFILLLLCISLSLMAQDIELPKPKKEGGMPLMQAYRTHDKSCVPIH